MTPIDFAALMFRMLSSKKTTSEGATPSSRKTNSYA